MFDLRCLCEVFVTIATILRGAHQKADVEFAHDLAIGGFVAFETRGEEGKRVGISIAVCHCYLEWLW